MSLFGQKIDLTDYLDPKEYVMLTEMLKTQEDIIRQMFDVFNDAGVKGLKPLTLKKQIRKLEKVKKISRKDLKEIIRGVDALISFFNGDNTRESETRDFFVSVKKKLSRI